MASIARSRAGYAAARRCANATAARRCASATAARRRFASDATSSEAQRDGVTRAAVETKRPSRFEEAFEEFREGRAAQTLTLSAVQVVAERKIEEAMKSGAFDSLEGAGKPRVRTAFNDSAAEAVTGAARGAYVANGALAAAGFVPESVRLRNEIEAEREALREALRAANGVVVSDQLRARAKALRESIRRQHRACVADAIKGGGMLPQAPPFDLEAECRDLKAPREPQ